MLKGNRTFSRIFVSYLIILVIPMTVLGVVNYYQTLKILEDKIERDSIAALRHSSYIVDSFVEKLYKLSSELQLNQRVDDFLHIKPNSVAEKNLLAREIMLDLRQYTILNNFIGDIYVYSKINNAIVSPTGLYTPEFFFKSLYLGAYNQFDYYDWLHSINQPNFRKFVPVTVQSNYSADTEKILFTDSLPNIRDNLGCIMIFMDRDKYMDAFSDVIKGYNGSYYILNKELQIIISDGTQIYDDLLVENLTSDSGAKTISTTKGKALLVHTSSSKNKWKYVSIIPYDAFTKEINSLKLSTILIISIFVTIAFIVSLFAANKNYEPIKKIINFISTTYGYRSDGSDDYKVISNILESSYKEIKFNQEIIKSHIPVIRQSHLVKLLKDSNEVELSKAPNFNVLLDIDLRFSTSTVILFNLKRVSDGADQHTENELNKLALRRAIEELVENNDKAYAVELDHDTIACIYGSNENNIDNVGRNVLSFVMKIKSYFENKLNVILLVGIGNVYNGYKHLSTSYEEADQAISYAVLMDKEVVLYRDILKSNHVFAFPIQKELQLVSYIKSGKQEEALGIINALYNENCINKELTYEMMKFFIYDLYCSIIKAVSELKLDNNDTIVNSIKELDAQNIGSKDMSFFLVDIKRIVIYICKMVNDQKKNMSTELKNKIIRYIEENFIDNQLSLEKIANEFNITPQYLSRFFKEHFGINYLDYVNSKRVKKAKEYLLNNVKVKDAAAKSGFNNIGTFINVFRKHTGLTPGEYKEINE